MRAPSAYTYTRTRVLDNQLFPLPLILRTALAMKARALARIYAAHRAGAYYRYTYKREINAARKYPRKNSEEFEVSLVQQLVSMKKQALRARALAIMGILFQFPSKPSLSLTNSLPPLQEPFSLAFISI